MSRTILAKLQVAFRLPPTLHPMTQLGIGVAALNHNSSFQAAYEKGLIGRLPVLAARIYRNIYHPNNTLLTIDKDLDFVGQAERKFIASAVLMALFYLHREEPPHGSSPPYSLGHVCHSASFCDTHVFQPDHRRQS